MRVATPGRHGSITHAGQASSDELDRPDFCSPAVSIFGRGAGEQRAWLRDRVKRTLKFQSGNVHQTRSSRACLSCTRIRWETGSTADKDLQQIAVLIGVRGQVPF
jgi:hypothetical protein